MGGPMTAGREDGTAGAQGQLRSSRGDREQARVVLAHSRGVSAVIGVLAVGLTGLIVAALLTALLIGLSWVVRCSQQGPAEGPPSGPAGLASRRPARARQLPSARRPPWQVAEAA